MHTLVNVCTKSHQPICRCCKLLKMSKPAKCIIHIVTIDVSDFSCLSIHYFILVHSYYLFSCGLVYDRCVSVFIIHETMYYLVFFSMSLAPMYLSLLHQCFDVSIVLMLYLLILLCVRTSYHCLFYVSKLLSVSLCCVDESLAAHDCYACNSLHLSMTL